MALIWQEIQAMSANWRAGVFRLSADTGAFLLSATSAFQERRLWTQDEPDFLPVTDSQWDEIEALTAQAYTEIMSPVMLGTIFPFITASPPEGALECDGTTYLRTDYPDLYAILDSVFIVDADHFLTPDLRGRAIISAGSGVGLTSYSVGDTGGEEKHQLTTSELAAHSHSVTDTGHTHTEGIAAPNATTIGPGAPQPTAIPAIGVTGLAFTGISIASTGADAPHENRQPYLALRYAVWGG